MVLSLNKAAKLDQNFDKHEKETSQRGETTTMPTFNSKLSADVAAMLDTEETRDFGSRGSTTYFSFAENPSGIPDVPQGSSQELLLEDIEEKSSVDGIFASFFKAENGAGIPGDGDKKFLRFVHDLTDNRKLVWETVLWNNRLYVQVPDDLAHQGSRDSFVALLDAAEEHLGCTQVILGLRQDTVDRAQLIRTFKFMGFELVPPGHPELPCSADYLFMASDI